EAADALGRASRAGRRAEEGRTRAHVLSPGDVVPRVPELGDAEIDRPAVFPGADGRWLTDAPPRCGKCGGVWRLDPEGLACRNCGRRWRAAESLRAMRTGRVQRMH